jgi:hypothetical protein
MHILNLFEAVYKSHVLSLVKKGLECGVLNRVGHRRREPRHGAPQQEDPARTAEGGEIGDN